MLQANSPARPARVFVTRSDAGVEVVVEGLPVEISLPNGLLGPLRSEADEQAGPSLTRCQAGGTVRAGCVRHLRGDAARAEGQSDQGASADPASPKSKRSSSNRPFRSAWAPAGSAACRAEVCTISASCRTRRLGRRTPITNSRWSGARHEIPGGLGIDGTGLITVRTLDLDHAARSAQADRRALPRSARSRCPVPIRRACPDVQFVLEDLALPVSSWLTPVATHGRFGLRRAVQQGDDDAGALRPHAGPDRGRPVQRCGLAAEDLPTALRDAGHRGGPDGGAVRRQR